MKYDFIRDPEKKGDDAVSVERVRKRKLDLIPRLICLLIALVVWIYMINLNDTDATVELTLKIDVVGAEQLKNESNLLIYGLDKSTISITVKGTQRELKKYTESDYSATVDVSKITGRGKQTLPIEISSPKGSKITVEEKAFQNVTLYSDVSVKKKVAFYAVEGNMTKVPWYKYATQVSEDFIELTGPASMIDMIDTARYTINGEFYSSKNFSGFALEFYDKNGDVVSFAEGAVSYSTADVIVSVKVSTTAEIPIVVVVTGEGSHLIAKPERATVTIEGDPTLVGTDKIMKYIVTLSQASAGIDVEVPISDQDLPEGVTVKDEGKTFIIHFEESDEESTSSSQEASGTEINE